MIYSNGSITYVNHERNLIGVLVEHGVFHVEVPASRIKSMEVDGIVRVKYIPDDQFATLLRVRKQPKFRFYKQGEVKYTAAHKPAPEHFVTCGTCLRRWDDKKFGTHGPRCHFEGSRGHH